MISSFVSYSTYGHSDSPWLGRLPEHWEALTVRRVCRVFAGATPSRAVPDYWLGGTIPWLASGDVNARRITDASQFITDAGFSASSTKWIQPGSVVVALAGQGKTKGMVATVEFPATCNQSLGVLEPDLAKIDYRYLAYYLESRYLDLRGLVGDGIRDGLNLDHLRAIPVPMPPLAEQAAIVSFLDHSDRRMGRYVAAKKRLIALLSEQKQAIIQRAVTRGLDPDVCVRPSGVEWLGDTPAHWDVVRAKRLFSPRRDLALPDDVQLSSTQAYGVIPQAEFEAKVGRRVVKISMHLEQRRHVEKDDFVISMRSFQGGLERAWASGAIRSSYVVLKPAPQVDVGFFSYLFKSRGYIRALQATADFIRDGQDLNFGNFCAVDLPLVPLGEQKAVATFISGMAAAIDAAVASTEREITLVREYRTRVIADVVTGKLDVREAAARLPDEVEKAELLAEVSALAEGDEPEKAADLAAADEAEA